MSELVKLITAWETFEKKYQGATVESFCSYYLLIKKEEEQGQQLFNSIMPPNTETQLAKIIGRISMMHQSYIKLALKDYPGIEPEWFFIMNAVYHKEEAPKSDIICYNFLEYSTGMDIIKRLMEAGFIIERQSPEDKRSKLVSLTEKGIQVLFTLYRLLYRTTHLVFKEVPERDQKLIIKLLQSTEIRNNRILSEGRNKSFDELFENEVNDEEAEELSKQFAELVAKFCAEEKNTGMKESQDLQYG